MSAGYTLNGTRAYIVILLPADGEKSTRQEKKEDPPRSTIFPGEINYISPFPFFL